MLYDLATNHPRLQTDKTEADTANQTVAHRLTLAYKEARLSERQYRGNLKIMYLTGHESVEQLLITLFWKLGTDQVSSSHGIASQVLAIE